MKAAMLYLLTLFIGLFSTVLMAADVPPATKTFIDKVAVANKYEIDTSGLALKYGKTVNASAFARQMIEDHTKAGVDFKATLAQDNLPVPSDALDVSHAAKYAQLRLFTTEQGFDAAFIDAQLKAHEEAVATFKDYATNGPTPSLKSFAERTLPTLEHHLDMAKSLRLKTSAED